MIPPPVLPAIGGSNVTAYSHVYIRAASRQPKTGGGMKQLVGYLSVFGLLMGGEDRAMAFTLTSEVFAANGPIPAPYTCDGDNISPPLAWTEPPDGTHSIALISDDPDAPAGTWVHWVVWNVPSAARQLAAGQTKQARLPDGTRQGFTDFKRPGYGGPCPPSGTHRYFFKLYALDTTLELPDASTKVDVLKAMDGHVLGQAELIGTYQRNR